MKKKKKKFEKSAWWTQGFYSPSPIFPSSAPHPRPLFTFPSPRVSKSALAKNIAADLAVMSTASTEDGMDYAQLSVEEQRKELNRRAIPISAEGVFSFNSNSIKIMLGSIIQVAFPS